MVFLISVSPLQPSPKQFSEGQDARYLEGGVSVCRHAKARRGWGADKKP
jgi:hypothetical protein